MKNKTDHSLVSNKKNEDSHIIQKSHPLYTLWKEPLSLEEFKILDFYLARINSHKPDQRTVEIGKGEIEKIFGVKYIRVDILDKRLENLMRTVSVDDAKKEDGRIRFPLFQKAQIYREVDHTMHLALTCSEEAMDYIFNLEKIGYIRYKLGNIVALTSRYSYLLYMHLEFNRHRRSWDVSIDDLKELLGCSNDELYKEYKYFNQRILRKVHKEIQEKTDLHYSYTAVKSGRFVVGIHFDMHDNQTKRLPAAEKPTSDESIREQQELWVSALERDGVCEFTPGQIKEIRTYLVCVPDDKLPQYTAVKDTQFAWYHYMAQKMAELDNRSSEKKIKNRYRYLIKMLKIDSGQSSDNSAS